MDGGHGGRARGRAADGTRAFLDRFTLLPLDQRVAERAVEIRRDLRLKPPDAVILATARTSGRMQTTRDGKGFAAPGPEVRLPYAL